MDIKKFVLSYYKGAAKDFHISRITNPTEALKLHTHNYFQIYYINSGKMTHYLGGDSAHLSHGDVFILPPDVPHYIQIEAGKVDFYSLSFTPELFFGVGEKNRIITDFLNALKNGARESIQPKITLSYEDMAFAEPIFHRILAEHQSDRAGKSEMIQSCLQVLLSLVAGIYFEERAVSLSPEENKNYVLYCIEYIESHYDEDLTLSRMVQLSAMSKSSFSALFHKMTGTTFKDYLNRYRIRKAEELLCAGEKNYAVSGRVGYRDFSTFYRNFLKYTGLSPMEYRRRKNEQAE